MDENKQSSGKRLFTSDDAAAYLNIKPQTLANWRHTRKNLDYVKIGRRVMYEKKALDQHIEENRVVLNA
ncbi:MAG: helix-turn-helix domain-containing protein [Desulfamplus sp.]|nr:helix-turn-helix domain-containing protein [Desulfamplus sp.]